jgi:hypothetical protein
MFKSNYSSATNRALYQAEEEYDADDGQPDYGILNPQSSTEADEDSERT